MSDVRPDSLVDGRYRLLQRLGSGGMADVFMAHDEQLGRRVALKLLYSRFAEDDQFVERFRREASAAAGLSHPNVVQVYDRGEWDGTYYIAMELLAGRTLKQVVTQDGPLPPDQAVDVVLQVLRAARFAHRRGIIHRDLKPHNVILDEEGRAKVTDFGIARAGASDMTQTGSIMGTAQYLSPEQAQGQPVTPQSDLYSIGIILYELLTGRVPFEGDSAVTIALKQVSEPPVPPRQLNPQVPPELDAVVLRALEKDPARRFADADEFIAALELARGGSGTLPPVVAAPPPEPEGRRWWPWALAALLLALGALATVLLLGRDPERVRVPDVVGAQVSSAQERLEREGFAVQVTRRPSDEPEGVVLSQRPRGGRLAEEGSRVRLTVSDGPGLSTVPDVVGRTRAAAREALRERGLEVAQREESSEDVPEGRVIETSPPAGTQVETGSEVTIVLSTGPPPVAVPGVGGQPVDDARAALEAVGLDAVVQEEASDDAEPGTVLRQDPAPGAEVPPGTDVTLVVAVEPPEVEVPDVTGDSLDEAREALEDAGFEVETEEETIDDPERDDQVIRQSPRGGRDAEPGSTVTIVIGRYEEPDPTTPEGGSPAPEEGGAAPGAAQGTEGEAPPGGEAAPPA